MVLRFPDLISIDDALKTTRSNYTRQSYSYHVAPSNVPHDPLHGGPYIQPKDAHFIGTLSGVVSDSAGNPLLLSNRHVFFIGETGPANIALWQPIRPPGTTNARVVGFTRTRRTPAGINFPLNKTLTQAEIAKLPTYYDAAVASVTVPYTFNIPGIGIPTGHTEPKIGMVVTLAGGTSGVTHGKITSISNNYKALENAPQGQYTYVKNAFVHSCKSTAGDSGSMIVEDATKKVVGLHMAGDDARPDYNVGCRASAIANAFGISFVGKSGIFTPPGYTPPTTCQPPKQIINGQCIVPPVTTPPFEIPEPILTIITNYPLPVGLGAIFLFAAIMSSSG